MLPLTILQFFLKNQIRIPSHRTLMTKGTGSKCIPPPKETPTLVKVVMVRNGQSEWNEKNIFCGWHDSPLSVAGYLEAKSAGNNLRLHKYSFDIAFTSMLTRAHQTLQEIRLLLKLRKIPIVKSWRLNDRHYGDLTGLNKTETAEYYGKEEVETWERTYSGRPPRIKPSHDYYKCITENKRYAGILERRDFPSAESLKNTTARTVPFWNKEIVPKIKALKRVLIVAHVSSLRSIIKTLDGLNDKQVMEVDLPQGVPFMYTIDVATMKPVKRYEFIGDRDIIHTMLGALKNKRQKPEERGF